MTRTLHGHPTHIAWTTTCTLLALVIGAKCTRAAEATSERPDPIADVAPLYPAEAAARIDSSLRAELLGDADATAPRCDDETFLRRAWLDVVGDLPSPEAITEFAFDPSSDKRAALIGRLLTDEQYGQNWARYWRDVVMYRRSDERALLTSSAMVVFLTEEFNKNTPWDEIAREMITAQGNLLENGAAGLIAAQWGEIPETAAEVSRVLMGVQIQCAQCHDHPTDRWKRDQFHELAAFFPRIAIRRIVNDNGGRRGFELISRERVRRRGRQPIDDRQGPEHFMPDLDDPAARGTLMEPVFFVTGEEMSTGISDRDRREQLADWMTSPTNPWFAKAVINRIWAELVGEGFYEPIDDLGPDRECSAPATMELLAEQFVAHNHDLKWLFTTIMLTDAYQRQSQPRRHYDETPFAANCPQRLRADQLFNSLTAALEIPDSQEPQRPQRGRPRSPRGALAAVFGYDPSEPRDEIAGAIDQALLLMNSPQLSLAMEARGSRTMLGRLISEMDDNQDVVVELYLRCLAREPNHGELRTCLKYIRDNDNRVEALEDILWALVNSTEFLYRK